MALLTSSEEPMQGRYAGSQDASTNAAGRPMASYQYEVLANDPGNMSGCSATELPGNVEAQRTSGHHHTPQRGTCKMAVRWAAPALAFAVALFFQTAGVYSGTTAYIAWMDSMNRGVRSLEERNLKSSGNVTSAPLQGILSPGQEVNGGHPIETDRGSSSRNSSAAASAVTPGVLHDVISQGSPSHQHSMFLDFFTLLIPVAWLALVFHSKDLLLWSHTLFCGTLLASLKGILAFSNIVPDPEGWEGCQARLGLDGLAYYRETADSSIGALGGFLSGLVDIIIIEICGLARGHRSRMCGGSIFSETTYFSALFSIGLVSFARARTKDGSLGLPVKTPLAVAVFLLALMLCDSMDGITSRLNYTVDIAVSLLLTFLVYTNAALAMAAEMWTHGHAWFMQMQVDGVADDPYTPCDLGMLDGYYLRSHIDRPRPMSDADVVAQEVGPMNRVLRAKNDELDAEEAKAKRMLDEEQQRGQDSHRRKRRDEEERLNNELNQLTKEFEKRVSDDLKIAEQKLKAELQISDKWESKVFDQVTRFSRIEAQFEQQRETLMLEAERTRQEISNAAAARTEAADRVLQARRESEELKRSKEEISSRLAEQDALRAATIRPPPDPGTPLSSVASSHSLTLMHAIDPEVQHVAGVGLAGALFHATAATGGASVTPPGTARSLGPGSGAEVRPDPTTRPAQAASSWFG